MRLVIAGGTGLFGRALLDHLAADGHDVIILSRSPQALEHDPLKNAQVIKWDTKDLEPWSDVVDGADIVINFAGENLAGDRFLPARWTSAKKQSLRSSRIESGRAIANSIAKAQVKPKVLIQASAVGYYGPRGNEKIAEDASAGEDYLARLCVDWEESTREVEQFGVRRVIMRTGIVLTAQGGPLPRLIRQFRLFAGGVFGKGDQYWPWIHLDDVVGSIRYFMENDQASGPFNVTSPTPVTNKQFSKELGKALGRPSFWPIPAFAMKLLVGEVSVVVLEGQRAIPDKLSQLGYEFRFDELGQALEDALSR